MNATNTTHPPRNPTDGEDGDADMMRALLGNEQDEDAAAGVGGGAGAAGGNAAGALQAALDGVDDGLDEEGASDLDEEAVNALREEFADLYEEALAAGIDPDELDISVSEGDGWEEGEEGSDGAGGGMEEEDELMAALEGDVSSSSYETDDDG